MRVGLHFGLQCILTVQDLQLPPFTLRNSELQGLLFHVHFVSAKFGLGSLDTDMGHNNNLTWMWGYIKILNHRICGPDFIIHAFFYVHLHIG